MFDQVEDFCRPATVPEALRLLQRGNGKARIIAGGTDVVVAGQDDIRILIDITRAGLSYIRGAAEGLSIGATTTLGEIEDSTELRRFASGILPKAAATCGSRPIRNIATLGGNVANASPAADMAVVLLALGASAILARVLGECAVPLPDYLSGAAEGRWSKTILVELEIPAPAAGRSGWSFQKLGRTEVDISLVSVAAGLGLDDAGKIAWARIALGSVAPTAVRAESAEELLIGRHPDAEAFEQAAAEAARTISPISDLRASADYRREMTTVLTARALRECAAAGGAQ